MQDYDPSTAPVVLDVGQDAAVTDPDNADFDGGSVTVSAILAGEAGDKLQVAPALVSGSDVNVGGATIGSILSDGIYPNDLVIRLNADATPARVTTLLQNITFETDPADVQQLNRTIRFSVADGRGGVGTASVTARLIAGGALGTVKWIGRRGRSLERGQ